MMILLWWMFVIGSVLLFLIFFLSLFRRCMSLLRPFSVIFCFVGCYQGLTACQPPIGMFDYGEGKVLGLSPGH